MNATEAGWADCEHCGEWIHPDEQQTVICPHCGLDSTGDDIIELMENFIAFHYYALPWRQAREYEAFGYIDIHRASLRNPLKLVCTSTHKLHTLYVQMTKYPPYTRVEDSTR
jgi:hypothetical protein